jgi:hypothetical protein
MRRITVIAAMLAAAMLAAAPASAQVKDQIYRDPDVGEQPVKMIRPRDAARIALDAIPGAKPLGVQRRGSLYIVKLKRGNRIMRVRIDAASGAIR